MEQVCAERYRFYGLARKLVVGISEEAPKATTNLQAQIFERERLFLAPYAKKSADSAGRKFPEPPHPYRGPFQRDRDRILHSSAFRRLSGKMQVFTGEMGDYHRTRLTHTHEVANIARTMGRALRLNEDLIEALALMHDLGHPPYGHAGEDALNECAQTFGSHFSHNQFGLTIVEEIEFRFRQYAGLNLTHEVLQGQTARTDKDSDGPRPLLEVQLVDAADSITYDAHDTDDAIKLGLVSLGEMKKLGLVGECIQFVSDQYVGLDEELMRQAVVHRLIDCQVSGVVEHCLKGLDEFGFQSVQEALSSSFLIEPDPELAGMKSELEQFLHRNVYRHPDLVLIRQNAQSRLKEMFAAYRQHPEFFPEKYRERARRIGIDRMAVEYIAGMTDRFCEEQYRKIFCES